MTKFDVIIIGAGPAGMTAAIFAARGRLSVLVVDESAPAGGTVNNTHLVANYPGFPEPISGLELTKKMFQQAKRFGAKFELLAEITDHDFKSELKWIEIDDDEKFEADNIIIATGINPRRLNLPGEEEFKGQGIHNLRAEKCTVDQVMANENVSIIWSHESQKFEKDGDKLVIFAENLDTKEIVKIKKDGLFIFVGMKPNSEWLLNSGLTIDERGYIPTDTNCLTNLKNIYAIGDIREKKFNQITIATADGTVAALEIIREKSCS